MASTKQSPRPLRTLIVLTVLVFLAFGTLFAGVKWSDASLTPNLALDLEGGTQIILTPVTTDGSKVTDSDINEAIRIIRQRVDGQNITEAEITSQGGNNIVVGIPGQPSQEVLESVRRSAQMNFRAVLKQEFAGITQEDLDGLSEKELQDLLGGDASQEDGLSGEEAPSDEETASGDESAVPEDEGTDDATDEESATNDGDSTTSSSLGHDALGHDADTAGVQTVANTVVATDGDEPITPISAPADPSDLAQITPEVLKEFEELSCLPGDFVSGDSGDPDTVLVTCADDGSVKYILGPVEIPGTDIARADSGLSQQGQVISNTWAVNIEFNKEGTNTFAAISERLVGQMNTAASLQAQGKTPAEIEALVAPNQFAMVLDGAVISAPTVGVIIPNGKAEITGNFTQESAASLANQLNFGALPLTFDVQSEQEISATLGSEQLQKGLIAGAIGLLLVVIYSLFQYRVLGLVTVTSLSLAAIITYAAVALLSWKMNYRLSLPGVAGLIVAIGITADSFIVYFERIRDELRDGRKLSVAIDKGWDRAKRTILASDTVNFLAAVVLYYLAVGGVRGFAFTLGLTTLVDLVVVFFFTHPLLKLISKTKFFAEGHPWSGLDPRRLGVRGPHYAGRGRISGPTPTGSDDDSDGVSTAPVTTDDERDSVLVSAVAVPAPAFDSDGRRLTIAERRAQAAAVQAAPQTADGTEGSDDPDRSDGDSTHSTEGEAASGDHEEKL